MTDEIQNNINNNNTSGPDNKDEWQADVINRLAFAAVNEQRRTRR